MSTPSFEHYVEQGQTMFQAAAALRRSLRDRKFDTIAVHGMYTLEETLKNQGSLIEPAFMTPAQHFQDAQQMAAVFAYQHPGWAYSRIANPTVGYLEATLAMLEGYGTDLETSACVTASGMAAIFMATVPFLTQAPGTRMNIVVTAKCYGGTFQLFTERYAKERGVEVRFVQNNLDLDEWARHIDEETRFVFGEMPSNPGLGVFDIAGVAALAHAKGVPLIVDSTVATPALMRPLEYGADIVVHSLSKSMAASGLAIAGALVSRANIPSRVLDDAHRANFAFMNKFLSFRDHGPGISPLSALLILSDLRSLRQRLETMSAGTLEVARFLQGHPKVEAVSYPGLPDSPEHDLATQYMRVVDSASSAYSHLMAFSLRGGAEAASRAIDAFQMIFQATDLGKVKSVATLPTTTTHQQQGAAGRKLASIPSNMIRLSVGLEHPQDIIRDLEQALEKA